MDLTEGFLTALDSLLTNKMRAVLTMLGVIIGVAAVIALLSIGNGVNATVEDQVRAIGSNLISVLTERDASGGYETLTMNDLLALSDPFLAPSLGQVAAELQGTALVSAGSVDIGASVSGVTANYHQVRNLEFRFGSELTRADVDTAARVTILGWNAYRDLFPNGEFPVGEWIKIKGTSYQVIGVVESQGGMGLVGQDEKVFVPITTAQQRITPLRTRTGERAVTVIYAQALDESLMDSAAREIRQVLRDQHGIAYTADDDFSVLSQTDILEAFNVITDIFTIFLAAIAGISLLVGGIGIMNIMLVSVTERTREIGIRKAVGALRRDILVQFLLESLVLSLVGGTIGIAFGITLSTMVGNLSEDLNPVIDMGTVLMAFGFAAMVGIIFGIYPAWRAAGLRPIDALRYE
jgi:putative ABC transport system permease protein